MRQQGPPSPALKFYEAKAGFANYYFNKLERDRLLAAFHKHGDFSKVQGTWTMKAAGQLYTGGPRGKRIAALVAVKDKGAADGKNDAVQAIIDGIDFSLEPLNINEKSATFKEPPGSGGLLVALYQYRQMLAFGPKGFVGDFSHGGVEPFYLPAPVGELRRFHL